MTCHKISSLHKKSKTPYISCAIMAVTAYTLPLEQIAIAASVVFLLLFTQVNIVVIIIRRMYGNKLNYGFKTFFPICSYIKYNFNLTLAIYPLLTQPLSWGISISWIMIGFIVYHLHTFKKELDHYTHLVTSEGDLTRKNYKILIPYTPGNLDRLVNMDYVLLKKKPEN
ncbi:MAG: hypothetical protein H0X03_05365 [Nitrosopumilus sp.]|nr:hypothetical protein [Nitrosopumilus sp.]